MSLCTAILISKITSAKGRARGSCGMIIAQQEAREELDLVVTKGRGRSGHGSGHDSNLRLKSRNTKLPMHVAVLHSGSLRLSGFRACACAG